MGRPSTANLFKQTSLDTWLPSVAGEAVSGLGSATPWQRDLQEAQDMAQLSITLACGKDDTQTDHLL